MFLLFYFTTLLALTDGLAEVRPLAFEQGSGNERGLFSRLHYTVHFSLVI
jgi:hypothetical protein